MATTALTTAPVREPVATTYLPQVSPEAIEQALAIGDISQMSPAVRMAYYIATCQSAGLNPYTRPFDLMKAQDGKMYLYPNKVAAEQLRKIHRVSLIVTERRLDTESGLYFVTVKAQTPDGRQDESQGVVDVSGKKGEALANALMRAETKGKRRVTLAICGLGYETSEDAGAHPVRFDYQQGTIVEEPPAAPRSLLGSPSLRELSEDLYGGARPTDPHAPDLAGLHEVTTLLRQTGLNDEGIEAFWRVRCRDYHVAYPEKLSTAALSAIAGELSTQLPPQEEKRTTGDSEQNSEPMSPRHGGASFLMQIDAVMQAAGEDQTAITAYWQRTCKRCGVETPQDIKASWLPKLLEERRAYYAARESAPVKERDDDDRRAVEEAFGPTAGDAPRPEEVAHGR